ncbi:hypothetical protein R1flu_007963 [Riccia fluitans]|uniref:Uncharacterized protein n=1 Tax=Riccia fluitans TaxID=41844 RepID=A0ABD1YAJ6_9MARC
MLTINPALNYKEDVATRLLALIPRLALSELGRVYDQHYSLSWEPLPTPRVALLKFRTGSDTPSTPSRVRTGFSQDGSSLRAARPHSALEVNDFFQQISERVLTSAG